jgi:predicted enzyme related to lactoylglutathione lyase
MLIKQSSSTLRFSASRLTNVRPSLCHRIKCRLLKLWISGPKTSAARAMPDGRVPQPGGWNRLVLEVDDIHSLVNKLMQADAVFRNEIISGPGGSQVLVEDPSGNPIELFQAAK